MRKLQLNDLLNRIFYTAKPIIPRSFQIAVRRQIAKRKHRNGHHWPIDPHSNKAPAGWRGWPGGKRFAMVLSHDVDTRKGYDNVLKLADLEERMGFRSSFNFVPERYGEISLELLEQLRRRGFGIAVHGLKHDGKLFRSKKVFDERAPRINAFLNRWATRGFTAPSMIRKHDWMHRLEIDYCISTFDTDPFEPQPEGVGTIFPFVVYRKSVQGSEFSVQDSLFKIPRSSISPEPLTSDLRPLTSGFPSPGTQHPEPSFFVELPYTLPQDSTLFIILQEKSIDTWKRKLDWIAENGGMALLNSHPDYKNFNGGDCRPEEYPVRYYVEFLEYVKSRYGNQYWPALPQDMWLFWVECSRTAGNLGAFESTELRIRE
jgi:hypothetical protein